MLKERIWILAAAVGRALSDFSLLAGGKPGTGGGHDGRKQLEIQNVRFSVIKWNEMS